MKFAILALALVPSVFAAENIKLWMTNYGLWLPMGGKGCYATVDDENGCMTACQRKGKKVFYDADNWWKSALFGRFEDPRDGDSKWLNIWPEGEDAWGVYVENGDGKKIGLCKIVNDGPCTCQDENSAVAFGNCDMY